MAGGSSSSSSPCPPLAQRKLPILLFDVMDTIVRDPFYHDIPAFFNMSMKELLETKHPTAWAEFEMGLIDECKLSKMFFKDGRSFDLEGLKECMVNGYSYIDGIEALLHGLKEKHYELHAFTNYPIWYKMIEEKLKLSKYLSWTFCSCTIGKRKPAPDSYMEVLHRLGVEPANCIFIDDRLAWGEMTKEDKVVCTQMVVLSNTSYIRKKCKEELLLTRSVNIEAATNAGMVGLHFKDVDSLKKDLSVLGVAEAVAGDE